MARATPNGLGLRTGRGARVAERHEEQRREERVPASLPVKLAGDETGLTRDVSASGIFLEFDASYAPGTTISFSVDFETPGGRMVLNCQGEIVRMERRDSRIGVGVKILESRLEPARKVDAEDQQ